MNSRIIEVGYGTAARVIWLLLGGTMIAVGIVAYAEQWRDLEFLLPVGIAQLIVCFVFTSKPYSSYDVKAKTMYIYWGGTRRVRWKFGSPNGERLYVENGRIRRIGPGGRPKTVLMLWGCDRSARDQLVRVIESQERSRLAKERNKRD